MPVVNESVRLGESIGVQVTRADGTVESEPITIRQLLLLLAKLVVEKLEKEATHANPK